MATEQVGNYTVLLSKRLGQGTYGTVYQAKDNRTNATLAVKHSRRIKDLVTEESYSEANILRDIEPHENIINMIALEVVDVVDSFNMKNLDFYMFMDFCELGDLSILARRSALTFEQKTDVMLQCCVAIQHLHSQKPPIIHRDIKPGNFLVSRPPNSSDPAIVRLADFGISRLFERNPDFLLRTMTACMGTFPYMAPELFDDVPKYDEKVDTYSGGVSFISLLVSKKGKEMEAPKAEGLELGRYLQDVGEIEVAEVKDKPGDSMSMREVKMILRSMTEIKPQYRPNAGELVLRFTRICSLHKDVWKKLDGYEPQTDGATDESGSDGDSPTSASVTGAPVTGTPVTGTPVTAHHGYVQNAIEGYQTTQPAMCVQDKKEIRMLVFAKCLTLEELRHDTIRVTVYFANEHGHDPVKEGACMVANKDAGKLVGQRPVFISNNQHEILVEIVNIVLPSKLVESKSKLRSKLAFDLMWERYNGQSCTLVMRRATGREKGVDFTVVLKQHEFTVDIQVVEELCKLVPNEAFTQSCDSGVNSNLGYYRVRAPSSEGDDGPEARLATQSKTQESKSHKSKTQESKSHKSKTQESKSHKSNAQESKSHKSKTQESKSHKSKTQESKSHKSKTQESKSHKSKTQENKSHKSKTQESKSHKSKTQESKSQNSVRWEVANDSESHYSANKASASSLGEPIPAQHGTTRGHGEDTSDVEPPPSNSTVQDDESVFCGCKPRVAAQTAPRRTQRPLHPRNTTPLQTMSRISQMLTNPRNPLQPIDRLSSRSFTDEGLHDDSVYAGYSSTPVVFNVGQLHVAHTNIRNESVRGYESIEHFQSDRFPEVLLKPMRPLDLGDWKMLASHLKMDQVVESIETQVKNHRESPIRLLMDEFWKSKGQGAHLDTVKQALEKMRRRDLLDDLEDAETEWQSEDT